MRTVGQMKAARQQILDLIQENDKEEVRKETGCSGAEVSFQELGIDLYVQIVLCIYHSELEGNFPRLLDLLENMLSGHGKEELRILKRDFECSRWQKMIPVVNARASMHASDYLMLTKYLVFVFSRVFVLRNLKAPLRVFLEQQGEDFARQWMIEVLQLVVLECTRQKIIRLRVSFSIFEYKIIIFFFDLCLGKGRGRFAISG